jgi:3-oxoacyl-[acyl-carrier protein] reductase
MPEAATDSTSLPLADQVAVVTGASGGIGRAIALELATRGAHVVVHGFHHPGAAEGVADLVREMGRESTVLLADVTDVAARENFVASAWNWRGGIDVWVNNAGADVLTGEAAHWSFEKKLAALWRVDVEATVSMSRDVGARMKSRGRGVILNMGWDQAEQGMAGDSGEIFATVKGAVMAFTRSLAQSLAPEVRVNGLAPGWIRTTWAEGASQYWQTRATRQSLRGRWGTPEDVARVAAFLASPQADFVSGQIVPINGGFRYE